MAVVKAPEGTRAPKAVAFSTTLTTHPAPTIRRAAERITAEVDSVTAVNEPQLEKETI